MNVKKNLYKLLCDPATGEDLELIIEKKIGDEILKGKLVSQSNEYKIINSIPRFIDKENYSNNFGWQWNKWANVQFDHSNIDKPMEGYTSKMFSQITEWDKENLSEKKAISEKDTKILYESKQNLKIEEDRIINFDNEKNHIKSDIDQNTKTSNEILTELKKIESYELEVKIKEYQKEIMIFDSLKKESNINEIIKYIH